MVRDMVEWMMNDVVVVMPYRLTNLYACEDMILLWFHGDCSNPRSTR